MVFFFRLLLGTLVMQGEKFEIKNWRFKIGNWKLIIEDSKLRIGNRKLKNWKLKTENWKLKIENCGLKIEFVLYFWSIFQTMHSTIAHSVRTQIDNGGEKLRSFDCTPIRYGKSTYRCTIFTPRSTAPSTNKTSDNNAKAKFKRTENKQLNGSKFSKHQMRFTYNKFDQRWEKPRCILFSFRRIELV